MRQYIHGGLQYDDPIEVTTAVAGVVAGSDAISRVYPVYDEAGAGNLQALLNVNGEVIERAFSEGAFGEDEFAMKAPLIDRIAASARKRADGSIDEVVVSLRMTERVKETTVADGVIVEFLDASGSSLGSRGTASVDSSDPYTILWRFTGEEWSAALAAPGVAQLRIRATSALRSSTWADLPLLPVPETGVSGVESSPEFPVTLREPIANLTAELIENTAPGATGNLPLLEIPNLYVAAADETPLNLVAAFKAYPFAEPANGLVYARNRWYDPSTGTFLSPDPEGYGDSSNLYAFCGGDPINGSDPTGQREMTPDEKAKIAALHEVGRQLHDEWYGTGYAEVTTYQWGAKPGLYPSLRDVEYNWVESPYPITTQVEYENARRMLVEDINAYQEVIDEAAEGEAVEYVPIFKQRLERFRVQTAVLTTFEAGLTIVAVAQDSRPPAFVERPRNPNKGWKDLIFGRAQKTNTEGHQFRTYREAIEMAKSGQYSEVWLDKSYSKVTGVKTSPVRRPDIIAKRTTGQIDSVEVPSRSDVPANLYNRNAIAMQQLPVPIRGTVRVAPITKGPK